MAATGRRKKKANRAGIVTRLVLDCEKLDSAPRIVDRFAALIESDGFTSFMCLRWQPSGLPSAANILATTRPRPWLAEYQACEHAAHDPVLREVPVRMRPFAWSDIARHRTLDENEQRVLAQAAVHGMKDGFAVPVIGLGEHFGLVSLAGEECDLRPSTRARLTLASHYFYHLLAVHRRRASLSRPKLSARELEIVRWVAAGKSDWDIGRILAISAKTVNYHVERVKRKLGVATRTQAVLAALAMPAEGA